MRKSNGPARISGQAGWLEKEFRLTERSTIRSAERERAVLQAAIGYVRSGYVWAAKISLDPIASIRDERFKARIAQLVHDDQVEACFVSQLSKEFNSFEERLDGGLCLERSFPKALEGDVSFLDTTERICYGIVSAELDRRERRFLKTDDGIVLFAKSRKAANRAVCSIARFIERALHAHVNQETLEVRRVSDVSLFGLCVIDSADGPCVGVHQELVQRARSEARHATARSRGVALAQRFRELDGITSRYNALFALSDTQSNCVDELNEWLAARCRMVIWKNWKLVRTRVSGLESVGVDPARAKKLGGMHLGYWAAANTEGLKEALPYSTLRRMGFSFFSMRTER